MASTRKPGWPTCSHASPVIPPIGWTSCCHGTGRLRDLRSPLRRLDPMHTNKVHRVAEELGEHEDWLRDVASEMEIEDGVIWVYGVGEDGSWRSPTLALRA